MTASAVRQHVIVGLGMTGLSCARHLHHEGLPFMAVDSREQPPALAEFRAAFPDVELSLGGFPAERLATAEALVLSPGVDPREPAIRNAAERGVPLTGDIDLFSRKVTAPIIAITGSNAKSTVTTLVGAMAKQAGLRVAVAGNIGTPVLDLLRERQPQLYVLELSSFQLETTRRLGAGVATVLNLSEDHMDRYDSLQAYRLAKQRIYYGCRAAVFNRDDPATRPQAAGDFAHYSFGLDRARGAGEFGLCEQGGREFLACAGEALLEVAELRIPGRHNVANALAALAIGEAAGLPRAAMLEALRQFTGLRHRCQFVARIKEADWYNDSKGTNVGATIAAVEGLSPRGPVVLLAGGVGKGADFRPLAPVLARHARLAILFGADAERIEAVLQGQVRVQRVDSLEAAVAAAHREASPGDQILLSPACASFDMFRNYEHRGEVFMAAVEALR